MPMQATTTTPLFSAALRPDRSLRTAGGWLALVLSGLAAIPFMLTVPEVALPAGVAIVLTGAGLTTLSMRQARRRRITQTVTLWPDQLEIITTDAGGTRTLRRFDPQTVRLKLDRDEDEKTRGLHLRHGEDSIELGAFLGLDDKASFAKALGTALRKARR